MINVYTLSGLVVPDVNPVQPTQVLISAGYSTASDGKRLPVYQTPASITASVDGNVLTVSEIAYGMLAPGQLLFDDGRQPLFDDGRQPLFDSAGNPMYSSGTVLIPGTRITRQLTGVTGCIGTYIISGPSQTVGSESMGTLLPMQAQVQALTYRDLRQLEGLNLNGTRRGIYLYGDAQGVQRVNRRGGDLIVTRTGNVWLVAIALETWTHWCKVAATLQDTIALLDSAGNPMYDSVGNLLENSP